MAQFLGAPGTCRVLVVDDDRDATDSLVSMLKLWGLTAYAAYDARRQRSPKKRFNLPWCCSTSICLGSTASPQRP